MRARSAAATAAVEALAEACAGPAAVVAAALDAADAGADEGFAVTATKADGVNDDDASEAFTAAIAVRRAPTCESLNARSMFEPVRPDGGVCLRSSIKPQKKF